MRENQKGIIPIIGLLGVSFLVLTMASLTAVVANPEIRQTIFASAKGKNEDKEKGPKTKSWRDIGNPKARQAGRAAEEAQNAAAEKQQEAFTALGQQGWDQAQVINPNAKPGEAGYKCTSNCGDTEVSGYYRADNGKFYAVGGTGNTPLDYKSSSQLSAEAGKTVAEAAANTATNPVDTRTERKEALLDPQIPSQQSQSSSGLTSDLSKQGQVSDKISSDRSKQGQTSDKISSDLSKPASGGSFTVSPTTTRTTGPETINFQIPVLTGFDTSTTNVQVSPSLNFGPLSLLGPSTNVPVQYPTGIDTTPLGVSLTLPQFTTSTTNFGFPVPSGFTTSTTPVSVGPTLNLGPVSLLGPSTNISVPYPTGVTTTQASIPFIIPGFTLPRIDLIPQNLLLR